MTRLILALILIVVPMGRNSVQAGVPPTCETAILPSEYKLIEDFKTHKDKLWDWVFQPASDLESLRAVEKIIQLDPQKKKTYLETLKQDNVSFAQDPKIHLLKMLLNDEKAWMQFLEHVQVYGDEGGWLLDALYPVLNQLPPDLKTQIHQYIALHYASVKKYSSPLPDSLARIWKKAWLTLGPKRAFDAILRALYPPEHIISLAIQNGKLHEEAFDIYIEQVQTIFEKTPVGGYFGPSIRKALAAIAGLVETHFRDLNANPLHSELLIYGSFVSGKAKLTVEGAGVSDIDTIFYPVMSDPKEDLLDLSEESIKDYQMKTASAEISRVNEIGQSTLNKINLSLQNQLEDIFSIAELRLDLSAHSGLDYGFNDTARINPVVFLVGHQGILMVVFDPLYSTSNNVVDMFGGKYSYKVYPFGKPHFACGK